MLNENISCTICLTDNINIINSYKTNCNHIFCKDCFNNWLNHHNYTCPICRATIKEYKNENEINKLIYINTNTNNTNTNNTNTNREVVVSNLNQNLLYQNLRLKSCTIILFIFFIFSLNFFFITYMNYQYYFNKYIKYRNCRIYECDINNTSICYDI